jgi:hypothetical protein
LRDSEVILSNAHDPMESADDLKLIACLLEAVTIREASEKAGVSEATLYRRLREPGFRRSLREARYRAFGLALSKLQASATEAVDALRHIMKDQDAPPASRVRAAVAILEWASRDFEPETLQGRLDADARQAALERRDRGAYLRAGGAEANWRFQELMDDINRTEGT